MILFFFSPFGTGSTSISGLPFPSSRKRTILPGLFCHFPQTIGSPTLKNAARLEFVAIGLQKSACPSNFVCHTLTAWLAGRPQFEVLDAVVTSVAVDVMDVLASSELSHQMLLHHMPVFGDAFPVRSEEHTSELQSQSNLVCRLLLEKKKL